MMDEILILYQCKDCDTAHYFEPDSLPGGLEHCKYCEECFGELVEVKND